MIGISKLYCGQIEPSDPIRYGRRSGALPSHLLQFSADKKPVVVWNCTKRCNLACVHCYSASNNTPDPAELTGDEARAIIDDLADFGVPVLLFSGGEPMLRPDLLDFLSYAKQKGMRTVLSTNGTLITPAIAEKLAGVGLNYVGISLDGATPETNDKFRGQPGAFDKALAAIRNCKSAGVKVGLRFTITAHNAADVLQILDLIEREKIPRVCFYHLVSAGRGGQLADGCLTSEQTREVLDIIITRTRALHEAGLNTEVLMVGNHADGPYLYMKILQEDPARAAEVYELLQMNGGNNSGVGLGCISWDGCVHPDQFWREKVLGNIRQQPFSEIWSGKNSELLQQLRNRQKLLECRCNRCKFLDVCNGNLRARAVAAGNGTWGDDPACYLTDEEIAK